LILRCCAAEMVFERRAKNRGSKRPGSYPPDPELDAFSHSPTCSPPQFSDQPADLFSAGLRPRPPQSESDGSGMPDRATNERESKPASTDSFSPHTDLQPFSQNATFSRSELKHQSDFYFPPDSDLDRLSHNPTFVA